MRVAVLAAALGLVGGVAAADTWSVGYGAVPATYAFGIDDANTKGGFNRQGEDSFSLSQLVVSYEHARNITDALSLTLLTGAGIPLGTGTHAGTSEVANSPAGTLNNALNTGDETEYSAFTLPVLIGARYTVPVGKNTLSLGAGVGGVILGVHARQTDVAWDPPGETAKLTTVVSESTTFLPTWAVLATIGFHLSMDQGTAISLTAPVGVLGEVHFATETTNHIPGANELPMEEVGGHAGGFIYGINVGWSRTF